MSKEPQEQPAVVDDAILGDGKVIGHYREIARVSRLMLEAAQRGDWDGVDVLVGQCAALIGALKQAAQIEHLDRDEQAQRVALLRSILDDDAQIRLRAEPWLRDLEQILGSGRVPTDREG